MSIGERWRIGALEALATRGRVMSFLFVVVTLGLSGPREACASFTSTPAFRTQDVSTEAYYRFENGAVGQAASGQGSILDSSPNGHHGDPSGGPVYTDTECSFPDVALRLDGGDDHLRLPGEFVFNRGAGDGTVEFSIKTPAARPQAAVLWTRIDGSDTNRFHLYVDQGGGLGLDYRDPNGVLHVLIAPDQGWSVDVGQWTHVAVSRTVGETGAGVYRFYKNGEEAHSVMDGSDPASLPDSPGLAVGWRLAQPYDRLEGVLDEIRFSRRAVPPEEFAFLCADCNGNGSADYDDIASGTSADCNGNAIPDECEILDDASRDWNGDGVLDACVSANYCVAEQNSTGMPAAIGADGTPVVTENDFALEAWGLPLNEFAYFLASESTAFVPGFGGSSGNLCLGAPQYRFNIPAGGGEILHSGSTGTVAFKLDLTHLPQGIAFDPGETWYFQLWYRDFTTVPTSNTTDGIEVMFR